MHVQALGYVGIGTKRLDEWALFGTRFLGMQLADQSRSTVTLRMDDRKQRIVVYGSGSEGVAFIGWEVADSVALDALASRLDGAHIRIATGSKGLADQRLVKDLITLRDPIGNQLEIFHGAETTSEPFMPGRSISGFRTGPLGMGHIVLKVERLDEVLGFYRDILGFGVSELALGSSSACFLHVNSRHHSLAFFEGGKNGVHHIMVELFSLDDVGQAYDLAQTEEGRVAMTLGRHAGDFVTSFYASSPSGFMFEYGWGGRVINPERWRTIRRSSGPSIWGHDTMGQSPEQEATVRHNRLIAAAAAGGRRQPVQVIQGNHELMPGVCPSWDRIVKGGEPA